jgi:hypothetical protein
VGGVRPLRLRRQGTKRRINGKLQYSEEDGGEVKGTLTIGLGHTYAAGSPKIVQGTRVTRDQTCRMRIG